MQLPQRLLASSDSSGVHRMTPFRGTCAKLLVVAVALLATIGAPLGAHRPGTAAGARVFAQAMTALGNGDFDGVVRLLEPAMPALAADPRAWRTLGLAYLKLRRTLLAEKAYAKSLTLEPDDPQSLLYLGIVAAQGGDVELAFSWLAKAKDSRRIDMSQLDIEPDVATLRADPRYAPLLPRPEDFAHPFVEDVRVIREWDGESAGDQFGWIARVIGDVDGDGVNDFITSAPTKDIHGENAGRIYVYSGRTGALLWQVDGAPGDQLGTGIEAAGDTNGDGIPDVIGSAPYSNAAYLYSGRDGRVLLTLHGEAKDDRFGEHVSSVGDIDELRHDRVHVTDDGEVAELEDRRARVLVDRDDHLRVLHPDLVLHRTRDPQRDVQLRRDGLAGLTDLRRVRVPALVHDRARRREAARRGSACRDRQRGRASRPAGRAGRGRR